ncbi:uncharacterized protein LOC120130133 [Hibiscus syriacus]|uniref:uncharacterized protein LOC120130133 n=1 Tax=Hibiscus syriacus TaxID=106335 RepID=UPI0019250188|nr:uncharacterized protein LOC120130133 [Hibiscus syriacus]
MESKKEAGSSSSLTADHFGSKQSSSKGIFGSIFPPPSMLLESWTKQPLQHGMQAPLAGSATYSIANKERNSVFQEERMEPCHLSSSIYYGGRDIYGHPSSTKTSTSYPIFKKDGEDPKGRNPQDASRGNWFALLLEPSPAMHSTVHQFPRELFIKASK